MDIRKIKKLIELVEASSLSELEISSGEESIRLKKSDNNINTPKTDTKVTSLEQAIKASVSGTFHRAPSKDGQAYIEEGQVIAVGDTIGLIEASTLMNKVSSPFDGYVYKFLIEDGESVESGQPILLITPE